MPRYGLPSFLTSSFREGLIFLLTSGALVIVNTISSIARHLPEPITDKKPSADLWEGQTDEDELGFSYFDVDKLLYALIDLRYSPDEAIAAGFSEHFVERAYEMVRRSQFKRMTPLICKISHRTVGKDFRYLRDWGA